MLETAMEMEKKMDKMVRLLTVQILTEDIIDMDSDNDIAVLKATFELIDISKKMMVEQAKTIDEMNRKLDVILKKIRRLDLRVLSFFFFFYNCVIYKNVLY